MLASTRFHPAALDIATLCVAGLCIAALLGVFMVLAWIKERDMRALAWWGAAYLIGASAIAFWSVPQPYLLLPPEISSALIFIACGMIWNGARLFHGRRVLPIATFAGAAVWLILTQDRAIADSESARAVAGGIVVAGYTFFIAFELWRERRKSAFSRSAAIIVPMLHAGIILVPIAMKVFLPDDLGTYWLDVFVLEAVLYSVGTALIVLLLVKDRHVHIHRSAAETDHLTGLLNRRAFLDGARRLCAFQRARHQPVTLLMFDLDHFKSINDRFGHAAGDDVLRVFAQSTAATMRASDIIGRLGGEEFAAIVAAPLETTASIAERIRRKFELAGATVDGRHVGATVSIGAASSSLADADVEALLVRADAALYRAKGAGRNRVQLAEEGPTDTAHLIAAVRAANRATAARGGILRRNTGASPL